MFSIDDRYTKSISVGKLRMLLDSLPEGLALTCNDVGNLLIIDERTHEARGFINFLTEEITFFEDE